MLYVVYIVLLIFLCFVYSKAASIAFLSNIEIVCLKCRSFIDYLCIKPPTFKTIVFYSFTICITPHSHLPAFWWNIDVFDDCTGPISFVAMINHLLSM